jgi:hypothetical protein
MRIRIVNATFNALNSCGTSLYGEVEDYTINVTAAGIMVSGYVQTDALVPIEGVLISADTGESATTNPTGYYELDFPSPWSGTIEPTAIGWTFEPVQREYSELTTDVTDADFIGTGILEVELDLNNLWMYENVISATLSNLTAAVLVTDDPLSNSSYTYEWEIILPDDVTIAPVITAGGGSSDPNCTFAAPSCNEPNGISDSGQPLTVKVTVMGADFGNTCIAEAQFGIALLGDANNDGEVDVADRAIINVFWRLGTAGPYTFNDCNVNCDEVINVADRSIANAVWRGVLGKNSINTPCPFR